MQGSGRREEIRVPGMSEPVSHYTDVVRGGHDATAQARQVHENLKSCLAAAGATFADVCKVTVFLKNIADREKVNADDFLVEIEAIAALPE